RAAYEHQLGVESRERVVVGVNRFETDGERTEIPQPDYGSLETAQRAKLQRFRAERDASEVHARLSALRSAAEGNENLMPRIIEAVKAGGTLGEISDAFRTTWGVYRPQ